MTGGRAGGNEEGRGYDVKGEKIPLTDAVHPSVRLSNGLYIVIDAIKHHATTIHGNDLFLMSLFQHILAYKFRTANEKELQNHCSLFIFASKDAMPSKVIRGSI